MKKKRRLVSLAVAMLLFIGISTGCGSNDIVDIHHPEDIEALIDEGLVIDLALEMVPLTASPALFSIPMPAASGVNVKKNAKAEIDYSNANDGYVMVRFLQNTNKQLRVIITGPSGVKYTYTLKQNGEFEVYPLSDGRGNYTVTAFEQVEGTRYSTANSASFNAALTDEFAPFLRPNQYVNFNQNSAVVRKAAELVAGKTDFMDKVAAIYQFVITNIVYDVELAETVESDYLPDVDRILASGKGICFDYAALMAAMLRSQGIPTKLVIGYTGDVYHAWISVFSKEEGWLDSVIFFDGNEWRLMDPTFAASISSNELSQFIGDGANYTAKFMH